MGRDGYGVGSGGVRRGSMLHTMQTGNRARETINKEPPHGLNQYAQKLLRNL